MNLRDGPRLCAVPALDRAQQLPLRGAVRAELARNTPAILTPERIARLQAAGFSDPDTNSPNYYRTYPFDTFDDAGLAAAC